MTIVGDEVDVDSVLVRREGQVLVITLNRPAQCNAIDPPMTARIEAAMHELEEDPELRVGIVRAEVRSPNPVFCAGHDLKHFLKTIGTPEEMAVTTARGGFAGVTERPRRKPVVAAVRGLATAGGWEIVLACDIVIASELASFALPEVRWNLMASGGGGLLVPRVAGRYVAADLMLTGQPIGARRAYELGLVSRLVADDQVDETALLVARAIIANAPRAVELSRALATRAGDVDDAAGWAIMNRGLAELRTSDDLKEGLTAFGQKRAPHWTGQ
jgi:enoyl-CoA hydratase